MMRERRVCAVERRPSFPAATDARPHRATRALACVTCHTTPSPPGVRAPRPRHSSHVSNFLSNTFVSPLARSRRSATRDAQQRVQSCER
jgi:hypothetical protein